MAETAFKTKYRDEYIAAFEARETLVRKCVTTEAEINGNAAVFLVAGSGGAEAVTRGVNGLIPARADDNTQLTCTLAEWHDLVRKTRFNVFASQGNQTRLMQETTMAVVNRKIDADIIAALETGTQDTGAVATMSLDLAMYAKVILGNNDVPTGSNLFWLITPAAEAYLMQTKEFASADYTSRKPFDKEDTGVFTSFRWNSANWIVHPNLTGAGTAAEKCICFHRSAIGHAIDMERLQTPIGYDEEQDYSWARASGFFGSKLLQNTGVVIVNHDGSAYAAQ
jgi:hypothetical protein